MRLPSNLTTLLISLLLLLFLLSITANIRFLFSGRAAAPNDTDFSVDNSYIFISPLEARADNIERIRVTVVVLSSEGKGVSGKKVAINKSADLSIEELQTLTDVYGRAIYDIFTTKAGDYFIQAVVDGRAIGEEVRVGFYE